MPRITAPRNRAIGASFEEHILYSANAFDVLLARQHPAVLFLGNNEVRITGKAWPDWLGFAGRVPIAFDAKSTNNKKTYRAEKRRQHQFVNLRALSRHQVFAFYLVEWRRFALFEVFPVIAAAQWPFVRHQGEGVAQFTDLSELWPWLISGESSLK